MQISVTSRHMELTDALKDYIKNKVTKLNKYLDVILDANIILSVENKHRHIVEITLTTRGMTFNSEGFTDNMYTSIDRVIDKLETQVRRFKDKKKEHKQKHKIPSKEMHLTSELIDADMLQNEKNEAQAIKTQQVTLKHMTIDEAIDNLKSCKIKCLMFINLFNNKINTMYQTQDEELIILEPEF